MNTAIYIGEDYNNPLFSFDEDSIISISINSSVDLIQNEMQTDTAEFVVFYDDDDGTMRNLAWETPIWIYSNDSFVKYYSTEVKRISAKQYHIRAISYVGFLDDEKFYGGVYNGIELPDLISLIVRTDGLNTLVPVTSLNVSKLNQDNQIGGTRVESPTFDPSEFSLKLRIMANRQYLKFKFNGFINDEYTADGSTTWYSPLMGSTSDNTTYNNYGIVGTFTRSSAADQYPSTTEFFFQFRSSSISIGTPNVGDIIEIDCNPMQGKVIINGVEHAISNTSTSDRVSVFVLGGGRYYINESKYDNHCNVEYLEYKVYNYLDNTLLFDMYPIWGTRSNSIFVRNGKYGKAYSVECGNPATSVPSGDDAPGSYDPEYRKDFVETISYSPSAMHYRVYGWIPICTKREAIHQLLLSSGFSLKKDSSGNWLFTENQNTISANIPQERIFDNGNIEYSNTVGEVVLKEHTFIDSETLGESSESIYSTEDPSSTIYVAEYTKKPSKPTIEGGIIYASTENASLIPGDVVNIIGYPYRHDEKIYSKKSNNPGGSTISLENVTTITPENSAIMFERLENYYLKTHTCKFDIVKNGEKCGAKYSFINPFNEEDSGFLISSKDSLSSFTKATCEFLCGYEPVTQDNAYYNYVILTGSGTWEVPESVFEQDNPHIRVVLIGGGNGGYSGLAGATGMSAARNQFTTASAGGEAGDPGDGGKIYDIIINNPTAWYSYSAGSGGNGAAITTSTSTHNSGGTGGDSTLTDGTNTYSSALGSSSESGHINFLTGDRYAGQFKLPGWKEIIRNTKFTKLQNRYGYGGWGGYTSYNTRASDLETKGGNSFRTSANHGYNNEWDEYDPDNSGNVGGSPGTCYPSGASYESQYTHGGGQGGGAGIGWKGERGSAATSSKAGNGGKGGDAIWIPPDALDYNPLFYGYGGHGGGGGGGGGASGYTKNGTTGVGGQGGYGGCGGRGGDGCIIVYY